MWLIEDFGTEIFLLKDLRVCCIIEKRFVYLKKRFKRNPEKNVNTIDRENGHLIMKCDGENRLYDCIYACFYRKIAAEKAAIDYMHR